MATIIFPTASSSLSTLRKPFLNPPSLTIPLHPSPPITLPPSPHPSPFKTLKSTFKIQSSISPITTSNLSTHPSSPHQQSLKSRLKNGETLYGLFLLTFSPTLAEIAALSGYDFVVVDMEHGHGGTASALPCLHALAAARTPAILRIPESNATWAKKALDLGPQGIMLPMIDGPKMARKAVSYCRFPPNGVRGSAHTVVRASGYGIDEGYLSNYEEELLIMCQVESEEGVEKIKEIASVDGVDCVQMGPLDLSASMGYLWDPGNKKVREVLRQAEKAVLGMEGGAYLGGFAMPHDEPGDLRLRGYHMVSGAVDVGLFRSAAVEDVRKFKSSLVEGGGGDGEEVECGEVCDNDDEDERYWSE